MRPRPATDVPLSSPHYELTVEHATRREGTMGYLPKKLRMGHARRLKRAALQSGRFTPPRSSAEVTTKEWSLRDERTVLRFVVQYPKVG